eukprot:EG_transcript_15582
MAMAVAEATPLVHSRELSKHLGKPVYLKLDALRPSGSFKDRGIHHLLVDMAQRGVTHVVSSSGGNAGLATALCGQRLGLGVTVVVPTTTKPLMLDRIRACGADVIVHGEDWNAADARAQELMVQEGWGYVHPFDNPLLWQGHASLVEELHEQLAGQRPGCVVLSVGGGGLLCGVLEGLQKVGWQDVPVIACETIGAASFAAALEAGTLVKLPAITTIATSLGAREVAQAALSNAVDHPGKVYSYTTDDATTVRALVRFLTDHRLLVEPACACALAAVYERAARLAPCASVCVVVCGGSGVSPALLNDWCASLGVVV